MHILYVLLTGPLYASRQVVGNVFLFGFVYSVSYKRGEDTGDADVKSNSGILSWDLGI
jgi:hypothetical protein